MRLASRFGRYGYRRVTDMLRIEGWGVKHKRVERIWRQEGLKVPERQPKRGRLWLNDGSCIRLRPLYRGHVWSYDFVASRTHDGRALKLLTVLGRAHEGVPGRSWWLARSARTTCSRCWPICSSDTASPSI